MAERKTDWRTMLLLAAMYAILIGNVALYRTAPLALGIHIGLSAVAIHLAFTIWHDAAHFSVSPKQWVNNVVGVLGMLPYKTPYFMQRRVHLRHHSYLNQPNDPNVIYTDGPFWQILLRYPRVLAYAKTVMAEDPRSRNEKISDTLSTCFVVSIYAIAWYRGFFLDVVLLWAVPLVVAKLIMDWYINYLPHVGLPPSRFGGTRVLDVNWLTPLVLGHNYHAIHHLWPNLPWHRYRAVFRDKFDYLKDNGVPIESGVFRSRAPAPRPAG
jgi:fatty acid desaturase